MSRAVVLAVAVVGLGATGGGGPNGPHLSLHPDREFAGAPVEAQLRGFLPFEELSWRWDDDPIVPVDSSSDRVGPGGEARVLLQVPDDQEVGPHEVSAVGGRGSFASAIFVVERPSEGTVYRLPSSTTTSTAAGDDEGTAAPATVPTVREEAPARTAPTAAPTTTARAEQEVPDRFSVRLENTGGGDDGPPSWLPALGPAAIIALFGGRILVRHLTREVEIGGDQAGAAEAGHEQGGRR